MVEDIFGILGTTLAGTFHIEEVIAEGGFGVVYRAEHVAFRAPVALKCLKIPGTISPSQSEMFVENFREEAEILFHLSAQIPEVVRPLHADALTLEDGTFVPYIAMEWLEGKPLDSIIILREDDGLPPLSMKAVLKMLTPIAHALHRAHRFQVPGGAVVSVTHCDLKPENIVITDRDTPVRAKILDFGIAKARDTMRQNVGRITDSEASRPFTPSYGAPEQWVPKRYGQTGPWTDVWGMALTMVECLTGRPPIDGDMHAMMGTCLDQSRRPSPRTEGAKISDDVERVFQKALAVDPRNRYNDIESFWTALEDAQGAPSSFQRSKRGDDLFEVAEPEPAAAAGGEFDGLELDEPPPSPPPRSGRGVASPRVPFESSVEADPFDRAPSNRSGEFAIEEEVPSVRDIPSGRGIIDSKIDLDLSDDSVPPAAASRPRPAATSGTWPQPDMVRTGRGPMSPAARGQVGASVSTHPSLGSRLRTPIILLVVGLGLTALDMVLAKTLGGTVSLGPLKIRWIAAALAGVGVLLAFWNLLGDRDHD